MRVMVWATMHINFRQDSGEGQGTRMKEDSAISEGTLDEMKKHSGREGYDDLQMKSFFQALSVKRTKIFGGSWNDIFLFEHKGQRKSTVKK